MKYRTTVAGIVVLFAFVPFSASAVTAEELATQVQSLTALLTALKTVMNQNQVSNPVLPNVLTTPNYCPALTRTLSRGAEGADVLALQKYLIFQKYLSSDSNSSFFGPMTESAVRNWQQTHGVVSSGDAASTGWGVVGLRTRGAIAAECVNLSNEASSTAHSCSVAPPPSTVCSTGWQATKDSQGCTTSFRCSVPPLGVSTTTSLFSVSPTIGAIPLTVTFSTTITNPRSYAEGSYRIDYGDAQIDTIAGCSLANVCTLDSGTHTHIYRTTGTFTAQLTFTDRLGCPGSSSSCGSVQILDVKTIVVNSL